MLFWINRLIWPFGLQLYVSVPQGNDGPIFHAAELHVLRNDPWEPVPFEGTPEEEQELLARALSWIAGRVTPVAVEPVEEPAEGSPPSGDGSPAGPVH